MSTALFKKSTTQNNGAKTLTVTFPKQRQPTFANMLRRTLMNDIPAVAVVGVEIRVNTSFFACDVLAQRLGLVPVRSHIRAGTRFVIDAVGPLDVFSDIAAVIDGGTGSSHSRGDPAAASSLNGGVFLPGILLFKLASGQRVTLTGRAGEGTGKKHARYQITSGVRLEQQRDSGDTTVRFETINDTDPVAVADLAAARLIDRLQALRADIVARGRGCE